ncbi:MAG: D-tyrosyl-tRNA(Tyr) deacylase [Clostridia bacterium]|nr:D-tyrosyl-tRNA(Tyr) deacylase [Clostridia bacterium]
MKIVLQRVKNASVSVDGKTIGEIGKGYLALLGVSNTDTKEIAEKIAEKISKLRIFEDENGKTNLSASDVYGEILVVSQFTLYADCKKGNRPSFTNAGSPDLANELYEYFIEICKPKFKKVAHGEFGADMQVSLINDGPFTVILDSDNI